ncbi:hypothetical protein IQ241_09560 [Romeria aff. gracilis LEGE 07310]|uniref:Uncharacterized protein n=1 Tax=Vasconcelosia minhoensis LEGE 07310 TaxID=915328 RepID=A0A8J7DBC6_9CYAN|nr:hypothetical protein [Romeria gracilis]MBE9077542.1 hypothetical protein [Romeria aff. gracilis LEGE 07310]
MTLSEIQERALKLSVKERRQLIITLTRSVQPLKRSVDKPEGLAASLIGIAKTSEPSPTDEEVKAILDERLVRKYL